MHEILFLAHRIPYPPDKGDKIRSFHLLEELRQRYAVHLGAFVDDPADWAHRTVLEQRCASVCLRPLGRAVTLRRAVRAFTRSAALSETIYDDDVMHRYVGDVLATRASAAIGFSSACMPYLQRFRAHTPVFLDMVDRDSEKWRALAGRSRWPMQPLYAREARHVRALEQRAFDHMRNVFLISEAETEGLHERPANLAISGNGVDTDYFAPEPNRARPIDMPAGPTVVMTGAMDYPPNADAAQFLVREIMPLLKNGDTHIMIVGARPGRAVRTLNEHPRVTVTGRVPDTRPYLQHAGCVVAPLRVARGIQNKVLEGMAMAKPVVATPQAALGIDAEPERDLLVADTAVCMARAIDQVLADACPGLGVCARLCMTAHYGWSQRLAPILDTIAACQPAREAA